MNWHSILYDDRRWGWVVAVVLALGAAWTWYARLPAAPAQSAQAPASPRQGFAAPDFTLDLLDGGQVTLSELHGRPVVLNVWASWCLPCRAEMPAIQQVYEDYQEHGLVVLAANTTYQDNEADAAAFVAEHGLTFPIALDRDGEVSRAYRVQGMPSTFFIDAQGNIQAVVIGGPISEAVLRSKVEDLLAAAIEVGEAP